MKRHERVVPFEIRKADKDGGYFEGFANVFHNIDNYGTIFVPGAFQEAIPNFLSEGFIGGINHDWDNPIGRPAAAEEQEKGLFIGANLSDTTYSRDVKILLMDKVIQKLSIGFQVAGSECLETAEEVAKYWEGHNYTPTAEDIARAQYGARLLTKIKPLYEVSPVTVPGNKHADITGVRSVDIEELEKLSDVEFLLRDAAGISRKDSKLLFARLKTLLRDAGSEYSLEQPTTLSEPSRAALEAEYLRRKARYQRGVRHAELSRLHEAGQR